MKKVLSSIMMAALVMVFISCSQSEQPIVSNDSNGMSQEESMDYFVPNLDDLVSFSDATMDLDAELMPDGAAGPKGPMHKGDRGDMKNRHKKGFSLYKILRSMDFTEEQHKQIREFMKEFRKCMREVMAGSRDDRKEIIQQAREERRAIIERYRNSDRTPEDREAARTALRELNKKIHEQMRGLMDQDAMCRCIKQLIKNIESILTPKQLVVWERYLSTLEGPCFGDND